MRVPSGSRSICHVSCYLLCHTDACSFGFTEHIRHVGVLTGITTYVLMYTHSRSISQLCHLLSIFILTLSMSPFSGKDRDTSASDRRISSDHAQGTSLPLQVTVFY